MHFIHRIKPQVLAPSNRTARLGTSPDFFSLLTSALGFLLTNTLRFQRFRKMLLTKLNHFFKKKKKNKKHGTGSCFICAKVMWQLMTSRNGHFEVKMLKLNKKSPPLKQNLEEWRRVNEYFRAKAEKSRYQSCWNLQQFQKRFFKRHVES